MGDDDVASGGQGSPAHSSSGRPGGSEQVRQVLCDWLWGPGYASETGPSETFPFGTVLLPFRLDPFDRSRRVGPKVDVFAPDAEGRYLELRDQLVARSVDAAALPESALVAVTEHVLARTADEWDVPWQLFGLVDIGSVDSDLLRSGVVDVTLDVVSDSSDGTSDGTSDGPRDGVPPDALVLVPLVSAGFGHPADELVGFVAPPSVSGLLLNSEGYLRDDDGNRIGEIRMLVGVLADGRWWWKRQVRPGSFAPLPSSTVGGRPVASPDDEPVLVVQVGSRDGLSGRVPETLGRLLQVAFTCPVDPFDVLNRALGAVAVMVTSSRRPVDEVWRLDPVCVSLVAAAFAYTDDESFDELALAGAAESLFDEVARRARADGPADWLTDDQLRSVAVSNALHAAAGMWRAVGGVDDELAAWWGTELLVAQLSESLPSLQESFEQLSALDSTFASRLRAVVEHRQQVWGLPPSGLVGRSVGRNDPCPCSSGRKFKHCCG